MLSSFPGRHSAKMTQKNQMKQLRTTGYRRLWKQYRPGQGWYMTRRLGKSYLPKPMKAMSEAMIYVRTSEWHKLRAEFKE